MFLKYFIEYLTISIIIPITSQAMIVNIMWPYSDSNISKRNSKLKGSDGNNNGTHKNGFVDPNKNWQGK